MSSRSSVTPECKMFFLAELNGVNGEIGFLF